MGVAGTGWDRCLSRISGKRRDTKTGTDLGKLELESPHAPFLVSRAIAQPYTVVSIQGMHLWAGFSLQNEYLEL
jgi:hypothetical protein